MFINNCFHGGNKLFPRQKQSVSDVETDFRGVFRLKPKNVNNN